MYVLREILSNKEGLSFAVGDLESYDYMILDTDTGEVARSTYMNIPEPTLG